MYPTLKQQLETLVSAASESDQQVIKSILLSQPYIIIEKLKDPNFKLQYQLSLRVLLSEIFEQINPQHISIKLRCLKNLKNEIKSELIELDLKDTLDRIKDLIFNLSSQDLDEILEVCSGFITSAGIFTCEETRLKYTNRIYEISEIKDARDNIKQMIERSEKKEIIFHSILSKFKDNENMLKRLASFLHDLGIHEISGEIFTLIERANSEKTQKILEETERLRMIKSFDNSFSLKIVSKLDDLVQQLMLSSEGLIKKFISIRGNLTPIPEYDSHTFHFQELESDFRFCQESFYLLKTHTLFDFEPCFCLFISKFLGELSSYEFFGMCYYEFLEEKKNFFKELHQILKNKHIILTHTILQKMLTLKNSNDVSPFLQFLNRASSIKCLKLDPESVSIFRRLLNEPILQRVLSFFNSSSVNLNDELDLALSSVYLTDLPEGITGITLWTLHIVIKPFISTSFNHSRGAIFFVLLHELAHYLQRASCSTVSQSKEPFSPNLVDDGSLTEGGFLLEKKLFGNIVQMLTLKQAEFLLAGGFSTKIKDFRKSFDKLGVLSENNPTIKLERGCGSLYLETCGSHFSHFN